MIFHSSSTKGAEKQRWIVAARERDVIISRYVYLHNVKEFQEVYINADFTDFWWMLSLYFTMILLVLQPHDLQQKFQDFQNVCAVFGKKALLFPVHAAYSILSKLPGTRIKLLDGMLVINRMLLVILARQTWKGNLPVFLSGKVCDFLRHDWSFKCSEFIFEVWKMEILDSLTKISKKISKPNKIQNQESKVKIFVQKPLETLNSQTQGKNLKIAFEVLFLPTQ